MFRHFINKIYKLTSLRIEKTGSIAKYYRNNCERDRMKIKPIKSMGEALQVYINILSKILHFITDSFTVLNKSNDFSERFLNEVRKICMHQIS